MKITLKRNLQLQRHPLLAKVIVRIPRPDVAELIRAMQKQPEYMPRRLVVYLQREGLWDKSTNLITRKAEIVLKTGTLSSAERGIYYIWYCHDDPLLGTRPILIQRDSAAGTEMWRGAECPPKESIFTVNDAIDTCFYDGIRTTSLKLERLIPEVTRPPDKTGMLELLWHVTSEGSELHLNGQLEMLAPSQGFNFKQPRKDQPQAIDFRLQGFLQQVPTLLSELAEQQGYEWSREHNRALASLPTAASQLTTATVVKHQLTSVRTSHAGCYEAVLLEEYPLMPRDSAVAGQWHICWMEQQFEREYVTPAEVHKLQQVFLNLPAMTPFDIVPLHGQELINQLNRRSAPASFWHVAAMQDLNPSGQQWQLTAFSYQCGEHFELEQFIQRMTLGEPVEYCLYADRHFKTKKHARNLNYIQRVLNAQGGEVFTSAETLPEVPEHWLIREMTKDKTNHDRYWLFVTPSRRLCWKCTTSLDFIRQVGQTYQVDSDVSFMPIDNDQIPKLLERSLETLEGELA